ncbi:MAG TPA: cell division protein FtsL [Candidatus Sulfotelmatobacter sp.]|jgi:cell division protein FtsL|nr:cell division protein FtsL [Candidatus Sulfotelmatobacter sp.]
MKKKSVPLTEFRTVKRIDNSRHVRRVEPVKLKSFYKTAALGGAIALCCMLYIFQHFRCIDLSFQLEDLKQKQAQAAALNSELKLNIATLSRPSRIDQIARLKLGLTQPLPDQVREYDVPSAAQVASVRFARTNRAQ